MRSRSILTLTAAALSASLLFLYIAVESAASSGAIYTTVKDGTAVNQNIYGFDTDVYLSGGPQNTKFSGLPDGTYYFQITDPSGKTLLSTDNAICRQLVVSGERVNGSAGPPCKHPNGTFNAANGTTPVQMSPFAKTPNNGLEYKAWLIPIGSATISSSDAKVLVFNNNDAKTDNFKVQAQQVIPGSCQPSSSLSVLVTGTDVVAYVPKSNWGQILGSSGVAVVNVEGASVTNTLIGTGTDHINSCASNPLTGQTVCTANNNKVYVLKGTGLDPAVVTNPFSSAGSGLISFSGGSCTNCGVAMDATHNKAVIALSTGTGAGFQFLNLGASPAFEAPFNTMGPFGLVSEDPLIDPIRNRLLSASENNNYENIDVTTSTTPIFFERPIPGSREADSSGEDCSTGLVLAPYEFSSPSQLFVGDLASAVYTPGSPGTWTSLSANNILTESFLSAGASGVAVAQGTHLGVVTGEFGGGALTAIALPATSGVVTLPDWITCSISGFVNGFDPHTVTAYQSPSTGHAIAVLANAGATKLAIVDLTNMLNTTLVPRTVGGHGCSAAPLPPSVVTLITVP